MRYLAIPIVVVASVCAVGCTTVGNTPATAPDSTAAIATTSTSAPEATTTSTVALTTTTLDRVAEITAIFEDLERRRLEAIWVGDAQQYQLVFSNSEYHAASLEVLDRVNVTNPQGFTTISVEILADTGDCVAAFVSRDLSGAIEGGGLSQRVQVIEMVGGVWGLSWIGEGWLCDGPHPLQS